MKYTLIFDKSDHVPFYAKHLKYTHVAIVLHQRNGIDVGIDAKKGKIIIDAQKNLAPIREKYNAITFYRDIPSGLDLRCPSLSTCVSIVKKILGIRAWWIITPYQLYKYINNRICAHKNTGVGHEF